MKKIIIDRITLANISKATADIQKLIVKEFLKEGIGNCKKSERIQVRNYIQHLKDTKQ